MFFCSSWVTASGYKFPLAIVEWTVQYTCEDRTKVRVNSICVKGMTMQLFPVQDGTQN